jgi:hypothetical protein
MIVTEVAGGKRKEGRPSTVNSEAGLAEAGT